MIMIAHRGAENKRKCVCKNEQLADVTRKSQRGEGKDERRCLGRAFLALVCERYHTMVTITL